MTLRYISGAQRRGERGFTLVEMFVTIALVATGVLGIMYAVSGVQQAATTNQQEAQLESAMRQVTDYIRDSRSSTGMPYVLCASNSTYISSLASLANRPSKPAGIDWTVIRVYESNAGSRSGVGVTLPITTMGCSAATGTGDWGVQEIMVKVCTTSCSVPAPVHTLTRPVWKADA